MVGYNIYMKIAVKTKSARYFSSPWSCFLHGCSIVNMILVFLHRVRLDTKIDHNCFWSYGCFCTRKDGKMVINGLFGPHKNLVYYCCKENIQSMSTDPSQNDQVTEIKRDIKRPVVWSPAQSRIIFVIRSGWSGLYPAGSLTPTKNGDRTTSLADHVAFLRIQICSETHPALWTKDSCADAAMCFMCCCSINPMKFHWSRPCCSCSAKQPPLQLRR